MQTSKLFDGARAATAILIALVIAVGIISFVSNEPLVALSYFLLGPVDSLAHIGNVVEMAIPLAFTGLSCAVLFRSNLFNLGAEGLFFSSALFSAMLAANLKLPPVVSPLIHHSLRRLAGRSARLCSLRAQSKMGRKYVCGLYHDEQYPLWRMYVYPQ